jgi:molybdopterin molybdotransferase
MPKRAADWISIDDALARMINAVPRVDSGPVALSEADSRVLAEDILAPLDLPPWDNSAMDGYAVRSADLARVPVTLRLTESVPAGAFPTRSVDVGEAIKIMTGAPVPEGADTVIRVEHTEATGDAVTITSDTDVRRNIRNAGEDVAKGHVVAAKGIVLRPGMIGLLASVGRATVRVARRPRVAILSTGDELVDVCDFDRVMRGERIVNSNSYALAAAVRATGGIAEVLGIAQDRHDDLREKLTRGLQADALITSAGASVGEHDLVKDVLEAMGAKTDFWRVRMRPGSPFSFSVVNDVPVFGLPGNPVSAVVTFEVLVKPVLRAMQGRRDVYNETVQARLRAPVESKMGLTQFMRVRLSQEGNVLMAELTGPQGSGILSSVAHADGLMIVPEEVDELFAGDVVNVIRL